MQNTCAPDLMSELKTIAVQYLRLGKPSILFFGGVQRGLCPPCRTMGHILRSQNLPILVSMDCQILALPFLLKGQGSVTVNGEHFFEERTKGKEKGMGGEERPGEAKASKSKALAPPTKL